MTTANFDSLPDFPGVIELWRGAQQHLDQGYRTPFTDEMIDWPQFQQTMLIVCTGGRQQSLKHPFEWIGGFIPGAVQSKPPGARIGKEEGYASRMSSDGTPYIAQSIEDTKVCVPQEWIPGGAGLRPHPIQRNTIVATPTVGVTYHLADDTVGVFVEALRSDLRDTARVQVNIEVREGGSLSADWIRQVPSKFHVAGSLRITCPVCPKEHRIPDELFTKFLHQIRVSNAPWADVAWLD